VIRQARDYVVLLREPRCHNFVEARYSRAPGQGDDVAKTSGNSAMVLYPPQPRYA